MLDLKVTLIQSKLIWEDIEANIALFDKMIDGIQNHTHLVILPEMFTTGFTVNVRNFAQDMSGLSVKWLQDKSCRKNVDIVGSIIIKEGGKYFNRLLWAKPDGSLFSYDKKHLFRMSGEEKVYCAGNRNITVKLHGWKIRPFICYDLRFPVWTRNSGDLFDVALFVANWPAERSSHWKTLLLARAIENQCYVIGVNRVGTDGNDYLYNGDSSVIDPLGNIVFQKHLKACVHTVCLSYPVLKEYRETFPVWMDADRNLTDRNLTDRNLTGTV